MKCAHGVHSSEYCSVCQSCRTFAVLDEKPSAELTHEWNGRLCDAGLGINRARWPRGTRRFSVIGEAEQGKRTLESVFRTDDAPGHRWDALTPAEKTELLEQFVSTSAAEIERRTGIDRKTLWRYQRRVREALRPEMIEARRVLGFPDGEAQDALKTDLDSLFHTARAA